MKKIGAICLALILALGSLGVGYAMWSDTVVINGTVDTGKLVIGFQEVTSYDFEDEATEYPAKDVGDIDAEKIIKVGIHWSEFDQKFLDIFDQILVTANNTYPGYKAHVVYTVANGGTIPVHLVDWDVYDPTGELNVWWQKAPAGGPLNDAIATFWKDFDGNTVRDPNGDEDIFRVRFVNHLICTQLEPCDEVKGEFDILILQPAEQNHTYKFLAILTGEQWAE
jgi:predicted ribosomally synthesized peptide with SipW-like signal peptide